MRIKVLLISLLFILSTVDLLAQSVSGQVTNVSSDLPIIGTAVFLRSANNKFQIAKTTTDSSGKFSFANLKRRKYLLLAGQAQTSEHSIDTTISVEVKGDVWLNVFITRPCEYDKTWDTKICTRCGKSDMAIPISYAFHRVHSVEYIPSSSHQGVYTVKETGYEFYYGEERLKDCVPHWYCKRDKTKF